MFSISTKGDFKSTEAFLKKLADGNIYHNLERFGKMGVDALQKATPVDSAETANSWSYEVLQDSKSYSIIWNNSNVVNGTPVAILLQFGHGTRNGGYVQGRDFINPALRGIFDQMADEAWKAVTSS